MKRKLPHVFTLMLVALLADFFPAAAQMETFTEPLSQVSFPQKITMQYRDSTLTLSATGAAEKKLARKASKKGTEESRSILTVAHYMQNPPRSEAQKIYALVWESRGTKAFLINFNHRVPEGIVKGWFLSQAEKAEPAAVKKVQKSLEEFVNLFAGAFQVGERCTIQWLPDGATLVVMPNATEKVIADPGFAPFWWKLWLGEKSPFERADLVNRIVSL